MDLLFSNDAPGSYPNSWYAATATPLPPFATLKGETRADVAIVGGGYTGLSAALHLAELGYDVALLDAHRVGFGASGRNGGQLGSGQRTEQEVLEARHGMETARALWNMGEEAKALVRSLIERHQIDCDLAPGIAEFGFTRKETDELHSHAERLQTQYKYDAISTLSPSASQALCPSPAYHGGILDHGAAHLHPLKYTLGLTRAAQNAGVRIYERSHVTKITEGARVTVETKQGRVTADHVILACNGYLGDLHKAVPHRVMPINNFIAATEPLGTNAAQVLTENIAVTDTKFVVNYFRLSPDGRLLFGGGESYGYRFPRDMAATVRKPMAQIYPHLKDVQIDYVWGGTLAITLARMPYLARLSPNIITAAGYSGHGIGNATQAGKLMAQAIHGTSRGFDLFANLPHARFPGGALLRSPLLALAMTWYAMRDRLGL